MSDEKLQSALDAHRETWENGWAWWARGRPHLVPEGSRRHMPDQVRAAWEEQWFPHGTTLLDVGCGIGETASWLARHGYRVTAIDCSPTAIDEARRAHSGQERLRFVEHDMCSAPPPDGPFGALLDWGCLHTLPHVGQVAYARHLAAVSAEDARLLVFHMTPPAGKQRVITAVEELLAGDFELVEAEECVTTWGPKPRLGVALWLRRRSTASARPQETAGG